MIFNQDGYKTPLSIFFGSSPLQSIHMFLLMTSLVMTLFFGWAYPSQPRVVLFERSLPKVSQPSSAVWRDSFRKKYNVEMQVNIITTHPSMVYDGGVFTIEKLCTKHKQQNKDTYARIVLWYAGKASGTKIMYTWNILAFNQQKMSNWKFDGVGVWLIGMVSSFS